MGVRGLTSYIARHAELYLTPYELHDCSLAIDGDNLACNLYKDITGTYSAFGGDYDDFYRGVLEFFRVLAECNVRPLVLMDGGYEKRKLRMVDQRMRGKIAIIKRINPNGSIPVFPIMMKEVFVDAVRDSGVPVMRCVFEADDELAALGRKLNCPVLSYDSDFYIHNVRYIPLITLTVKSQLGFYKPGVQERRLRKFEAKSLEKRTKSQRIMHEVKHENIPAQKMKTKLQSYRYLDCCMYRVENLIARGSLSKEKLPLFAALLGNDYIARSSFKNFFAAGMGRVGRSRKMVLQQRRIRLILQWLKGETAESALEKILVRLRKSQRQSLKAQVQAATCGYLNELCHSFEYFQAHYPEYLEQCMIMGEVVEEEELEEEVEEEESEYETDNEETENIEQETEKQQLKVNDKEEKEDMEEQLCEEEESDNEEENTEETEEQLEDDVEDKTKQFPAWFLEKLYPGNLSRFFVDLLHLRKYINNPQIEHFQYAECHEVALPILKYIFTLLHTVLNEEVPPRFTKDGEELPICLNYMTRVQKINQICHNNYALVRPLPCSFDPHNPNPLLLQYIFQTTLSKLHTATLFERINELPKDMQLYFLAIVYWLHKSQHYDLQHIHALIICLVAMRTIDSSIPVERNINAFNKRFGKIIKRERSVRDKEAQETGKKRTVRPDLILLPIPERMQHVPKSDCFLVQEQLLKHYHMQEIFKKKYDHFATTVLHGFAEFQSIVFQLNALNALLDFPFEAPKMHNFFCGVFLYNLYDLLRARLDHVYFVQHNIFRDSVLMFDFYQYLLNWCLEFLPPWKQKPVVQTSKKVLKKQRHLARRKAAKESLKDANIVIADNENNEDDAFSDLNNKFNAFLKVC